MYGRYPPRPFTFPFSYIYFNSFSDHCFTTRITDNKSSLQALITALGQLDDLCLTVEKKYKTDFEKGTFERFEEVYQGEKHDTGDTMMS